MRKSHPGLPDMKLIVTKNPFGNWADTPEVVLVPAINPDITIIHVQQSDPSGFAEFMAFLLPILSRPNRAHSYCHMRRNR